ncbi:MAG: hypothetical protein UDD43_05005 [Agathobacter sp.]|nr:hypothetical protein [Agathobacter sp.]
MKQTKETLPSVANSVETTQEENAVHSTVFDDVFRTIAQKMPQLLIPLINEVFHTNYSEDTDFEQLRNEHYEKYGKIITDSIIRIGPHLYHIECQSKRDADMVIRMFEYDISIALEHTSKAEDIWEIEFPQSCVLYVRNHRHLPEYHTAIVKFADGQQVTYQVPIIHAQKYTVNALFEKQLLILLPYHILRYEYFLKSNKSNEKKVEQLLEDYRKINQLLMETAEKEKKSGLYQNMICVIQEIADYIIPKDSEVRKGIGDIMGGNILTLPSDYIEEGRKEGRLNEIFSSVQEGDYSAMRGAQKAEMSIDQFEKAMLEAGYKIPAKA